MSNEKQIAILAAAALVALVLVVVTLSLSREVRKMKDAIAALVGAVNENTAATKAAIAAGFNDPLDVASIGAVTATVQQNTAALTAATPAGV